MPSKLSRRQVLRLISFLSAGTAAVGSAPFVSKFFANKANAQTGTVYNRENIATFAQSSQKIVALRRGIQVMQSRPASDPTSWRFQANIHGFPSGESIPNNQAQEVWATCQHGTYFFLSWHRMYLYYFEQILRAAANDNNLALPYWDSFTQRTIPAPFRNPANTSNPLYVSARDPIYNRINSPQQLPTDAVTYNRALESTNFYSATGSGNSFGSQVPGATLVPPHDTHRLSPHGRLESVPHDQVHSRVGGRSGWMRDVNLAARDPIFWLHHVHVDRLWEGWLQMGGGRTNPQGGTPAEDRWLNTIFVFYGADGTRKTLSGREIVDTVQQLNYGYDNVPSLAGRANAPSVRRTDANTQPQQVAMTASNQELTIVLSDASLTLTAPSQNLVRALTEESALTLNVEGIEYNPSNFIAYEIYINLPQGATPNTGSPYYAGDLALFAYPQGGTFSIEITDVVRELQRRNLTTGDFISVIFVPPPREIRRGRIVTEGRATQLEGAIRFKGVTITRQ